MGLRRKPDEEPQPKPLEVDASMTGTLTFRDPVNLQINGQFEGTLDCKGLLSIGPSARVKATIRGEQITIAGAVDGPVTASKRLELMTGANVTGKISTPQLVVHEGAILQGLCEMPREPVDENQWMTLEELARYLEVETQTVQEWAKAGRLPGRQDGAQWRFDRARVEAWLAQEKIR